MTPTRLQLTHMLHGITSGPRSLITLEKGDRFERRALHGVDGWLITDQRNKSIWVPLGAVAGVDVELVPEPAFNNATGATLNYDHPPGFDSPPLNTTCPMCAKVCGNVAGLKAHLRAKHPNSWEATAP